MPPISAEQWKTLPTALGRVVRTLSFWDSKRARLERLTGSPPRLERRGFLSSWNLLNRPPVEGAVREGIVRGWFVDAQHGRWPELTVRSASGSSVPARFTRKPSPDLVHSLGVSGAGSNRFEAEFYECPDICRVVATLEDGELSVATESGAQAAMPGAMLYLDAAEDARAGRSPRQSLAAGILGGLAVVYGFLSPALIGVGLVASLALVLRSWKARATSVLTLLALAAWSMAAARVLILALIEISSFPASGHAYSLPCTHFAMLGAVLSLAGWIRLRARGRDEMEISFQD